MENILAVGVIIGVIDAVKRQWKGISGLYAILLSVVLGAVAGYFQFGGVIDVQTGILAGLFASGTYKIASKIGGE